MPQIRKSRAGRAIAGLLGGLGCSSLWLSGIAPAATSDAVISQPIRQAIACPDRLEDLMPLLLRDLPSYANRVNQRAYLTHTATQTVNDPNTPGYVLLAGPPDYQALPLSPDQGSPEQDDPPQIFFTTLERQYVSGNAVKLQHYHRLFLTQTPSYGWQLVLLFSAIGDYPLHQPTSAPQDASQGVIAQAIRLWLRDCRAGAVEGKP